MPKLPKGCEVFSILETGLGVEIHHFVSLQKKILKDGEAASNNCCYFSVTFTSGLKLKKKKRKEIKVIQ